MIIIIIFSWFAMPRTTQRTILLLGKESTGKSQLISALTGQSAYSANFRGSTVTCETYETQDYQFIDTPGLLYRSDCQTTQGTLAQLEANETVILVVKATHAAEDLRDLLPLVAGKQGIVVMTFWDKIKAEANLVVKNWQEAGGLKIIPVNARNLREKNREAIFTALKTPSPFPQHWRPRETHASLEPAPTWLENPDWGWLCAIALLLLPAVIAVWGANAFAGVVDPLVATLLDPIITALSSLPFLFKEILVGSYGLVTMGPLLFVWAVPTVILYALLLGAYKASGLLERLTIALHPLLRPFGLSGRDLVRVMMGFGCNVPAVISTRSCSGCTRQTCISAIAFGSACSYQFGATLAVFSAAKLQWLVIPYLLYLTITTLIYTRICSPSIARSPHNELMIEHQIFLEKPRIVEIWREAKGSIQQFLTNAIPIFIMITLIASVLDALGVISALATVINPIMGALNLPAEASLPVILASIRKDGLLLFAQADTVSVLTPLQILTGVYLAGVLLPCLVTVLTIAREQSLRFAFKLIAQQAIAAIGFSVLLAWGGILIGL